jgi:antitoxin HicB
MPVQTITMLKEGDMSEHGYRVIYEPIAEGGYQVIVPALPGIVTYGRTLDEAREMARDAIVCHLQGLIKDNEEIPDDPYVAQEQPLAEDIKVAV